MLIVDILRVFTYWYHCERPSLVGTIAFHVSFVRLFSCMYIGLFWHITGLFWHVSCWHLACIHLLVPLRPTIASGYWSVPWSFVRFFLCIYIGLFWHITYTHQNETFKRDIQKRPTKVTHKHQKRPKEACQLSLGFVCTTQKSPTKDTESGANDKLHFVKMQNHPLSLL